MEYFNKSAARNIFYGGSLVFLLIFLGLTTQSHLYALHNSTDTVTLTASVVHGKRVWEKHACINCHTILGEGAYFAPEVGNVWVRYGGKEDPEGAREALKTWIKNSTDGHRRPQADAALRSYRTRIERPHRFPEMDE